MGVVTADVQEGRHGIVVAEVGVVEWYRQWEWEGIVVSGGHLEVRYAKWGLSAIVCNSGYEFDLLGTRKDLADQSQSKREKEGHGVAQVQRGMVVYLQDLREVDG